MRYTPITTAAIAALMFLTACGDDDNSGGVMAQEEIDAALEEAGFEPVPDGIAEDVTVTECGMGADGRPYAAGNVTNGHDLTLGYTVLVEIDVSIDIPSDPGAGPIPGEGVTVAGTDMSPSDLERVAPGETRDWTAVATGWLEPVGLTVEWVPTFDCAAPQVHGSTYQEG